MLMKAIAERNLALLDSLIDVVSCLRAGQMNGNKDKQWRRLLREGEQFTSHLAFHILSKEALLFAALKKEIPQSELEVSSLEIEHAFIRDQAKELVAYASEGDSVRALDLAKNLLRRLLEHVRAEESAMGRLFARLKGQERAALHKLLGKPSRSKEPPGRHPRSTNRRGKKTKRFNASTSRAGMQSGRAS